MAKVSAMSADPASTRNEPGYVLTADERKDIIERARRMIPTYDRHFRELMAEYERLERPWWRRRGSEAG